MPTCSAGRWPQRVPSRATPSSTPVSRAALTSPSARPGADDEVLFFVGVEDVAETLQQAERLGGTIVQPAQQVPGTSFGVFADAQGHKVGVASSG